MVSFFKMLQPKAILLSLFLLVFSCAIASTLASENEVGEMAPLKFPEKLKPEDLILSYVNEMVSYEPRTLEIGDFDRFNTLFANAQLKLPDAEVSESGLTLTITNLVCSSVYVGDIQSNYTVFQENGQDVLAYTVSAFPVSITCSADYTFKALFIPGKGRFTAVAENTRVETRIDLSGGGVFADVPPNVASVEYCNADINTNGNISFEGATLQRLLNLFKQLISNVVDNYAADALCDLLSSSGPEVFGNLLAQTNTRLDQWSLLRTGDLSNPLSVEQNFVAPESVTLIDFQPPTNTTSPSVSDFFVRFLKNEADGFFGDAVVDPVTGQSDLAINAFLRKTLIDETTGSWIVDLSAFTDFNPILFQSHDKLTQSTLTIKGAEIIGLDTLQTFQPFNDIGSYTVTNALKWESLSMAIALTVDIRPSTRSDSILLNPDPVNIVEDITIRVDWTNVNVDLAIFMPIDRDLFESMSLGSILSTKNLFPCFMSTLNSLDIAGLNVTVSDISVPTLEGFVSPGIDRLLTQFSEAAFLAYEPSLVRALPGLFQGPIRTMIKSRLIDSLVDVGGSDQCLKTIIPDGSTGAPVLLDFRDMFLSPSDAAGAGATGQQLYGNVGPLAYGFVQDRFNEMGDDELPKINQLVIQPFTKAQSGTPGLIRFSKNLFEFGSSDNSTLDAGRGLARSFMDDFGGLYFSFGDIRISNVDSISFPLEFLNLTERSSVLSNSITLGSAERSLNFTIRVLAGLSDSLNEIDFSVSIENLKINADVEALVVANRFLQFPLGDIMNHNCWLSVFSTIVLSDDGFADLEAIHSFSLVDVATSLSSLTISSNCVSCISDGISILPELLQIMIDADVIGTLTMRLPSLLDSLSMSTTTQAFFDRLVAESGKFCPSSPFYSAGAVKADYSALGFPALDSLSIDTLLCASILALQIGFILFAETQRTAVIAPSDPLSIQRDFVPPTDIRLLDWTDIGNSTGLGRIADIVFAKVRAFLSGNLENISDFEEIFDGILGNDGVLNLVTDFKLVNDGIILSVDSVQIRGIDAISLLNALEPIAAQTLSVVAAVETLDVTVVLSAGVVSSSEPPQIITTSLSLQNVSLAAALFAAFDLDKLGSLPLGSLFETKGIIQCFLSAAHRFELSQMKVSVESFGNPTFIGFRDDTALALSEGTAAFADRYRGAILEAIPKIFDGLGRNILSSVLNFTDLCSAVEDINDNEFLDFRDFLLPPDESIAFGGSGQSQYGNVFRIASSLIQDKFFAIDQDTGLAQINKGLIGDFTQSQSGKLGSLYFNGDLLKSDERIRAGGLDAKFRFRLYDAYVNNLDTIGAPISLLEPVNGQPYQLNNSVAIGLGRHLELGVRLFFGLSNEDSNIENELDIRLSMQALQILLTVFATVSEKAVMGFPISHVTNLHCWLATIPAPALDARGLRVNESDASFSVSDFLVTVFKIGLNVSCIYCSGPRIAELGELLSGIDGSDSVANVANSVFDLVGKLVKGNFLRLSVDRMLNDARKLCPHSPIYDPSFTGFKYEVFDIAKNDSAVSFFLGLIVVCATLTVIVLLIFLTTKLIVRRRHRKWIEALPQRQLDLLLIYQRKNDEEDAFINESTVSMFRSEVIPLSIRWFMIVVLIGNLAFFLSGHLSLAASVTILASLGGQTFTEEGFFEFSIAKSTIEIWNAGGQELAVLIFLFSFVWPYTKTVLTMALWFASPTKVSVVRRGSILLWLDFLAKWSTIDIFVLIVTIVSFRVSVKSPDIAFLPADIYSIDLLVAPKWGLYANLTAQIISQLSSHFIIHYHRRIVESASTNNSSIPDLPHTYTEPLDDDDNEIVQLETPPTKILPSSPVTLTLVKDRLCEHAFRRPHRGVTDKLVPCRFVGPVLVSLAILCCLLCAVGCALPSYSVIALGIVGILVESGQKFASAETSYSVFSTFTLLFDQASLTGTASDYIGLGTLSFILLVSVLLAPIAQSSVLLIQWFAPLTRKRRHRLMVLLEILQAWQYAEVYLLAIIVGSWQLGPISAFMINPYCEALKGFFAEMVYYGLLKDEDAQCFRTDVKIEPTFYLLFTSAICLALINSFVMKSVAQYFRDIHTTCIHDVLNANIANLEDITDIEGNSSVSASKSMIHPVPLLFTDRYRWLLCREDAKTLSPMHENPICSSDSLEPRSVHDNDGSWDAEMISHDTDIVSMPGLEFRDSSFDDSSMYTNTK